MVKVKRKVSRGYLYAKVNEFTTVTDFKKEDFGSFEEMEEAFKDWLWGTKEVKPDVTG